MEKPELNKVFDKVKEKQRVQEWESQKKPNKRTSLEMKLEQQASKLKEVRLTNSQELQSLLILPGRAVWAWFSPDSRLRQWKSC